MLDFTQAIHYWNQKVLEDNPRPATQQECQFLRNVGYNDGCSLTFYGNDALVIGAPYPSRYGASVMVRQLGSDVRLEAAVNPGALKMAREGR